MKKTTKKAAMKIIMLLIATIFTLAIFAGCGKEVAEPEAQETQEKEAQETAAAEKTQEAQEEVQQEASSKLVDEETTLRIIMPEHASYPVQDYDESPFLQYITELTNVKLDIMAIPDANDAYKEKLNVMLNSTDLADIIWSSSNDETINLLATKGMFLPYSDNLDSAPNIKAVLDGDETIVKTFAAQDGKLYIMPRLTLNTMTEIFIAREDVWEAEGLAQPEDYEDLYKMLKTLKDKYPDKMIYVNRWGTEHIVTRLAYSWGSGYEQSTNGYYLNRDADKYVYGPAEENFKEMVVWLKKLYDEGILNEDYALMSTAQWEEAFANENALFSIDYIARIKTINTPYISSGSTARVVALTPPVGPTGKQGIYGRAKAMSNSGIVINASSDKVDTALKFVDWIFSDEGRYTATYGIEDETYTLDEEGYPSLTPQMKRQANPDGKDMIKDYGWVYYLNKYEFPEGFLQTTEGDPEPVDDRYMYSRAVMEDIGAVITPDPVLSYSDEQIKVIKTSGTDIRDYFKQNIDKFIMGTRPMDEWEQFIEEVKQLGLSDVEQVLNEAYEAYKLK